METCLVVKQQRVEYESRGKNLGPVRYGGSPPSSSGFRKINCRSFQSGAGLLPTPLKTCHSNSSSSYCSTPVGRSPDSPMVVSPSTDCGSEWKELSITSSILIETKDYKNDFRFHESHYSELWAGPSYSTSPPPSSVPIPTFSSRSRPVRSVSLELPVVVREDIEIHPFSKSAPASPRDSNISLRNLFGTDNNATEALRRILNLDLCDE